MMISKAIKNLIRHYSCVPLAPSFIPLNASMAASVIISGGNVLAILSDANRAQIALSIIKRISVYVVNARRIFVVKHLPNYSMGASPLSKDGHLIISGAADRSGSLFTGPATIPHPRCMQRGFSGSFIEHFNRPALPKKTSCFRLIRQYFTKELL